jgi:hypothetical protein
MRASLVCDALAKAIDMRVVRLTRLDSLPPLITRRLDLARGIHLRVRHDRITDIDTIGELGDRLLLVSCKCRCDHQLRAGPILARGKTLLRGRFTANGRMTRNPP